MVTRAKWTEREQMAAFGALFDGEGCVHIGRPHGDDHYHSIRARISMTDSFYPYLFAERFGGTSRETTVGRKKHYRTVYHWAVASAQAGAFFEAILPWVVVKRPQVEIALRFRSL